MLMTPSLREPKKIDLWPTDDFPQNTEFDAAV
jgi:hypothetical protein